MFNTSYENKYMAKTTTLVICLNKAFLEKKVRMQKEGCVWVCPYESIVKPKAQRRSA